MKSDKYFLVSNDGHILSVLAPDLFLGYHSSQNFFFRAAAVLTLNKHFQLLF